MMRETGRSEMRRLSGEDCIFIGGETSTMPMHTMGVMVLDPSTVPDGEFSFERVVRMIRRRVHCMPPYRQRLIEVPLGLDHPVLVDDPDFEVSDHLHRGRVSGAGTLDDLGDFVASVAGKRLDRSRPLWDMWYVEGLEGDQIALVTKMHHCMIDGASGSDQMANFLDLAAEPESSEQPPPWNPGPLPTPIRLATGALVPRFPDVAQVASLARRIATGVYTSLPSVSTLVSPSALRNAAREKFAGAPDAPGTTAITAKRSAAFSRAMLADVKLVKKAFGVTVNDVVLSACTLALRNYLLRLHRLPNEPLLCGVPVSIKTDEEKQEFSNKVSVMSVALPMDIIDPAMLVLRMHEESEISKTRFAESDASLMNEVMDYVPISLLRLVAGAMSGFALADWVPSPANLVISNMAGPPIPLYLAGARVDAIFPLGPIAEGIGINITVLSNMDRIDLGIMACPDIVPDVRSLAAEFGPAIETLKKAAEQKMATSADSIDRPSSLPPS
jgi:WS/DGAT/MGAT family acyltransferase